MAFSTSLGILWAFLAALTIVGALTFFAFTAYFSIRKNTAVGWTFFVIALIFAQVSIFTFGANPNYQFVYIVAAVIGLVFVIWATAKYGCGCGGKSRGSSCMGCGGSGCGSSSCCGCGDNKGHRRKRCD